MKEDALRALGMTQKEIAVFLSNLNLGPALVFDIANSARINRTSAYDILASLADKGFVSYTITSGKKHYQAVNPNELLGLVREKEDLIRQALPELTAISGLSIKKPKVEVYAGQKGIQSLFENILNEAKSYRCIASKKHLATLFLYYFPHFVQRRIDNGIKVKLISDHIPLDRKAPYVLIKKPLKTAMWMYDNKIVMISLEEKDPIGILIVEKNICDTQIMMFDLIWDALKD